MHLECRLCGSTRVIMDLQLICDQYHPHVSRWLQIMIAERRSRGKGLAQEALQLVMAYAISCLVRLLT